jgi:hypothetical protein
MQDNFLENKSDRHDFPKPLLPRSAWNSQVAYLRAVFRAKKALDLAVLEYEEEIARAKSANIIQA